MLFVTNCLFYVIDYETDEPSDPCKAPAPGTFVVRWLKE
jgi:hypothetical protein